MARGKTTDEGVYRVTSPAEEAASSAQWLAQNRHPWGIENRRHGPRDVRMHEDHTRTTCPALGKMIACRNHRVIGWTAQWGWRHLMPARRYLDAHVDEAFRALMTRLV